MKRKQQRNIEEYNAIKTKTEKIKILYFLTIIKGAYLNNWHNNEVKKYYFCYKNTGSSILLTNTILIHLLASLLRNLTFVAIGNHILNNCEIERFKYQDCINVLM